MTDYLDGGWHRLHPATPFLRGGITFVAILGIVLVNLRDFIVTAIFGGGGREGDPGDPVELITSHNLVGAFFGAVAIVLLVLLGVFYLSWRTHTFRVADGTVEVRSGLLFRKQRQARIDRVQGINIQRPLLPRIFGAARIEVAVAGQDANVKLEYLPSRAADELRLELLRLASGSREPIASIPDARLGGFVETRMTEFLAPELDPTIAPPESVVQMHPGRLFGSIVLSGSMFWLLLFTVGPILLFTNTGEPASLVVVIPGIIGVGSVVVRRFTKSLRYSIAATDDGIRIGFGLLSTSNETLPPGRIHAIEVSQPLLWRPAGWWQVRVDRASSSHSRGSSAQESTEILPVGSLADVRRVLELILPALLDDSARILVERGLTSGGDFVISPPRARLVRWFSRRRNGFAHVPGALLVRKGAVWRSFIVVPLARSQAVSLQQGPVSRRLRLASVRVHTVNGPVTASIGALDRDDAAALFDTLAADAVVSAARDTAHRWREAPA